MRIVCIGGGPAGLYFSILAKLSNMDHEVTVLERDPAGVTYGWGVTILDELLDDLFRKDPTSAQQVWESSDRWHEYDVRVAGKPPTHLCGYGFSVERHRLLDILAKRAVSLGVDVRFQCDVDDLSQFADADLVVACDGANSKVRRVCADHFEPTVDMGRNKYIWLGTDKEFEKFTFAFEPTPAGWIWLYAYPFTGGASTCIVECSPQTWQALGFDRLDPDQTIRLLEKIFASYLGGCSLIDQMRGLGRTGWLNFKWITNRCWHHERYVLMGDAAHTTHFSIGVGTMLALQDAVSLAEKLGEIDDLERALDAYERERIAALVRMQRAARLSSQWFEQLSSYVDLSPIRFAYSLWNRRGEHPPWRYPLHIAVQHAAPRALLRWLLSARKWARSRRRAALVGKRELSGVALHGGGLKRTASAPLGHAARSPFDVETGRENASPATKS
jgi:2-polyprenyl-6-methoxyphenol hydroxylase-like FAD-dependent oxidoreductase